MIVNDHDIECITVGETKANSPLVIDSDTPLSLTIALEWLQTVRRWKPQIVKARYRIELRKTHDRAAANLGR
jgi:hypothetical protein